MNDKKYAALRAARSARRSSQTNPLWELIFSDLQIVNVSPIPMSLLMDGASCHYYDYSLIDDTFVHKSAGVIRTARKLAEGHVFIPAGIWDGGGI